MLHFLATLPPSFFFFNDTATTEIYTLSLHDALPIHFHDRAISQPRTLLSDGDRFVEVFDSQQEVPSDGLLGFRKWAIGHHAPMLSGNDLAFPFQGVAGDGLALLGQPVEPSHPLACNL